MRRLPEDVVSEVCCGGPQRCDQNFGKDFLAPNGPSGCPVRCSFGLHQRSDEAGETSQRGVLHVLPCVCLVFSVFLLSPVAFLLSFSFLANITDTHPPFSGTPTPTRRVERSSVPTGGDTKEEATEKVREKARSSTGPREVARYRRVHLSAGSRLLWGRVLSPVEATDSAGDTTML